MFPVVEVTTMSRRDQSIDTPKHDTIMDASLLIVGGEEFLAIILSRISRLFTGKIATTSCLDEVIALIGTQQPDILILQASSSGFELVRQIKTQDEFTWIYCILIEYTPDLLSETPVANKNQHLINQAEALLSGADAYLQMKYTKKLGTKLTQEELLYQDQLFIAQIQAGLRQVNNYRELLRANDLLSSIALADALTEVSNRRALEWELPRQIQKAHHNCTALSLIILDVDFFKLINDNHGHQVGDRVLQLLSARLQRSLRLQDTLFRYGGEEFVVILTNTSIQEAQRVSQRLCRLVGEQSFSIDGSLMLNVTVSLGVSYLQPEDDEQGVSLLRRADQNLLKAKASGRNQVIGDW